MRGGSQERAGLQTRHWGSSLGGSINQRMRDFNKCTRRILIFLCCLRDERHSLHHIPALQSRHFRPVPALTPRRVCVPWHPGGASGILRLRLAPDARVATQSFPLGVVAPPTGPTRQELTLCLAWAVRLWSALLFSPFLSFFFSLSPLSRPGSVVPIQPRTSLDGISGPEARPR